ncbi:XRE family transcriptional regulator [Mucilaginibacter limnophilus]|uniref:XRE family transcriptional regulator n=1 Tax=Mucilaginibacter limnophilus TaxID=1932778 RepID=A0A3S2UMQ3_9SPHI|nr:helix-turn-helix transcriptional regulator [Mucilaginibacter limnophilus]RVT99743.1 XRE family transcriptional regulator [Mucilaginibacter limnophilus]
MDKQKTIGELIRVQRAIKGYSQEYMAFQLEISQPAYSKIERNESDITVTRVFEIAEILEISAYELMPKPKYGCTINFTRISQVFSKVRQLFQAFRKVQLNP